MGAFSVTGIVTATPVPAKTSAAAAKPLAAAMRGAFDLHLRLLKKTPPEIWCMLAGIGRFPTRTGFPAKHAG